ncbi:hypothetical protein M3223_19060 [Paenibacillus pasadenensis]|uniref:hypothetical protein n=1 Tax=Paenibacillus pasadenensis TaxID=217090 RepID=UPI00203A5FAE|nr:hypothetical protein [Paenibacillus pasadenensis]MCM3749456.1 hypothetical protein [Paenibacillus pasadenensis]
MKQIFKRAAAVVGTAALVMAAGCTSESASPKAELEKAMASLSAAKSYTFNTTATFKELSMPQAAANEGGQGQTGSLAPGSIGDMLNGLKLTMDGVYQKDPMRTDANIKLTMPGNPSVELTLPMIMTGDKLYVQIPAIPGIQVPQELVGKYVMLDTAKMAQEQGQPAQMLDPSIQQRLMMDAGAAFIKPFDEKTYFKSLKAEDAGVPADLKPDSVVQFGIDSSNGEQAITTAVEQALPAVLDVVLSNEAYLKALGLDKAKVEEQKKQLADNKSELSAKLKQELKLNEVKIISAIKDGKLAYQSLDANIEYSGSAEGSGPVKLVMNNVTAYSKVDEAAAFTQEIPKDAVSVEELISKISMNLGTALPQS